MGFTRTRAGEATVLGCVQCWTVCLGWLAVGHMCVFLTNLVVFIHRFVSLLKNKICHRMLLFCGFNIVIQLYSLGFVSTKNKVVPA